jgi:hypothetical protein
MSVATYPVRVDADLDPLSRGLVLVKWWLLALPHYVVVGLLVGAGLRWPTGGLIGILVLVAGVLLAVRGRYPPDIFDLIVGCNRWVLRVAAYAGLMTDEYPPFRLDLGGRDPHEAVSSRDANS